MATGGEAYTAAVVGVGRATNSQGAKGGGHQIGYTHAEMFRRHPRVELVCGADISGENLRAFQERFGLSRGYGDYREMLREARPDLVSIGTYVGLHRQIIEDAARAGVKGIVCEKPLVASPADLEAVRRVAAETGVKVVAAHVRRYRPAFDRARELYAGGAVGEPVLCAAGIEGWDLSEWGSHWLDMFRFFHGDRPVRWVMGQARVRGLRGYGHAMEEHGVAYFEFDGGGKGLVDGGKKLNGGASMTLVGAAGTIRVYGEDRLEIDGEGGRRVEDFKGRPPVNWERIGVGRAANEWLELWDVTADELIRWIEGAESPRVGLPVAAGSAELNLAAYLSAVRGDRIDLPLAGADLEVAEWPVEILARRSF